MNKSWYIPLPDGRIAGHRRQDLPNGKTGLGDMGTASFPLIGADRLANVSPVIGSHSSQFGLVALTYANSGKPVFPCNPETKAPMIRGGFKRATTDEQVIAEWAKKYPDAMVGIPTGKESGVTVLDFDPECEATAEKMLPGMPESRTHSTPSGGVHVLFKYTPEAGTIGADVIPLPKGACTCEPTATKKCQIDLRNDGGYIIVPDSVRSDGGKYTVISNAGLAEMPSEILAKLKEGKREKRQAIAVPAGTAEGMYPEGQRNHALASLAGTMRSRGMGAETIEAALLVENQKKCNPPLPNHEVTAIATSIGSYPVTNSPQNSKLVNSDNSLVRIEKISEQTYSDSLKFPVDSLPEVVRNYCVEAAKAIGVPVEMVACPMLAYAGATIGRHQRIQLKRGFVQYPALWVVTVAPPGAAKSPADAAARIGIDQLQSEAKQVFDLAEERFKRDLQSWKDSTSNETRGPAPEAPVLEHYYSTDTTIEGLSRILANSPGIALSRDEIVGWVNAMDAYKGGKGSERQQHLSAWAYTPIKVDRKTSATLLIEHPVVSVVGGVQPDVMNELAVEAGRRDGFLERVLWIVPSAKPTRWSEDETSPEAIATLVSLFCRLRHTESTPKPVTLSRGAYKLFTSWYDENQNSIIESAGLMQGVYAKMPLQLARIALILHCFEHPDTPDSRTVSAESMAAAIKLTEYFRGQAGLALMMIGVGSKYRGSGTTAKLFQILTNAKGEWCSRSKLHKQLGGHTPAEEINQSLRELEDSELAEKRKPESNPTGGRRGEEWRITPSERTELSEETSWETVEPTEGESITEFTI